MSKDFYRAFEDRYRGSRDMIKDRLRAYLPFVDPLAGPLVDPLAGPLVTGDGAALALDLGCGRGEWLELLTEHAFTARGVDLDDGMLAACRERGLSVETADAIAALRAQPDDSLAVVSAFHLVEHIPFEALQDLVTQALRALKPGGLLIMETPNPENPMVGACRFYLDPSHLRPIPPNLLVFLAEHAGFARHKVVRLQEDPLLRAATAVRLMDVFDGASPDYGVVAQKAAAPEVTAQFDEAFGREFGLSLEELAQRFEQGHQAGVDALTRRLAEHAGDLARVEATVQQQAAETGARLAESQRQVADYASRLADLNLRFADMQAQLVLSQAEQARLHDTVNGALAQLQAAVVGAEDRRAATEHELLSVQGQLHAVLASKSWRVTAPLRWVGRLFRR